MPKLLNALRWKVAQYFEDQFNRNLMLKQGKDFAELRREDANILLKHFHLSSDFSGKTVLEVGGGMYGIASVIKAKEIVEVEPVRTDREHVEGVEYYDLKAEDMLTRFMPYSFDVCFMTNVLNHVEEPEHVLSNIQLLLKNGGLLYFTVHIQRLSHVHPHRYTPESASALIRKYFTVLEESLKSNKEIFGYEPSKIVPVWSCTAKKVVGD